jgi:hypothetical protein
MPRERAHNSRMISLKNTLRGLNGRVPVEDRPPARGFATSPQVRPATDESREYLANEADDPVVAGVATRLFGRRLMSASRTIEISADGAGAAPKNRHHCNSDRCSNARVPRTLMSTRPGGDQNTLNIESGELAMSHVRAAFARRARHQRKQGPVALAIVRLSAKPRRPGSPSSSKAPSWTAFDLQSRVESVSPCGFRGVVKAPINYLLTAMERGEAFDAALRDAGGRRGGGGSIAGRPG